MTMMMINELSVTRHPPHVCASIEYVTNAAPLNVEAAHDVRVQLLHQQLQLRNSLNFAAAHHSPSQVRKLACAPAALLCCSLVVEDDDAAMRSTAPQARAPCDGQYGVWVCGVRCAADAAALVAVAVMKVIVMV